MAKLDIAASQIQSTINMLKYDDNLTAEAWTAEGSNDKYPSAQAVANLVTTTTSAIIEACESASGSIEYPVGSVIMTQKDLATGETSTVANPATLLGLPGTWTLIDKAFKNGSSVIGPPDSFSPTSNGFSFSQETAVRNDHSIFLQLGLSVGSAASVPSGQTLLTMANLNVQRYGVYGFSYAPRNNMAFAVSSSSSTTSSVICYWLDGSGVLSLRDVLNGGTNTHTLGSGAYIYINTVILVPHGDMIDSFCDKFYWKRTA